MGYYAKKTLTGIKECAETEADYYVQSVSEYDESCNAYSKIKSELDDQTERYGRLCDTVQMLQYQWEQKNKANEKDMWDKMQKLYEQLNEKDDVIEKKEREIARLKEDLQNAESLNQNLKRIARERSNAKRGVKPKKERSGYIMLYCNQYRQKYGKNNYANTWHCRIQTPWDASLNLNEIGKTMYNDLSQALYAMGVRTIQPVDKDGEYQDWDDCVLYRKSFAANYRSGYWEFDFYVNRLLKVPEEYRPAFESSLRAKKSN